MANTKISALTSAATLTGTEVLPIVQSGATVKVANNDLRPKQIQSSATSGILQVLGPGAATSRVMTTPNADFTVARTDAAQSFTGDQTLSTGNLVQGTAAKGFNFTANTPATGMTSQLLNWYEEGTWTPTQGAGLVVVGAFTSSGRYTRIGRQVTISARLAGATSIACTAGGVFTSGLPYAPNAVAAGSATSSNLGGTVLYVDATTYSVSAMAASGVLYMTATYSV